MNEQEIMELLHSTFVEQFEIDPQDIYPEVRLYEDLGIDSIDAVDLIVRLKELTGLRITPEQFRTVRTLGDISRILSSLTVTRRTGS